MDKLTWDPYSIAREPQDPGFHQRRAINLRSRYLKALLARWQAMGPGHERVTAVCPWQSSTRAWASLPPPDQDALRRP